MSSYTRLERAVMEALAHDLRADVPDLSGQFEQSRPNQRRNSGFGLFTEVVIDQTCPKPSDGPTGDLGTVHVMVGNLPDPISFKARVRRGVLLGLLGDSYGQDTRAIDFSTVPFDQVFIVDARGRSISFTPTRPMPSSARPAPNHHKDRVPGNEGVHRQGQEVGAPSRQTPLPDGPLLQGPHPRPVSVPTDPTSLLIALWILIGVVAVLIVVVLRLPFPLAFIFAVAAGRAVRSPKFLASVGRAIEGWSSSGTSPSSR